MRPVSPYKQALLMRLRVGGGASLIGVRMPVMRIRVVGTPCATVLIPELIGERQIATSAYDGDREQTPRWIHPLKHGALQDYAAAKLMGTASLIEA